MLQFRVAADEEQESHLEPLSSLESDYFPAVVCREQMTRLLFLTHKVPLLSLCCLRADSLTHEMPLDGISVSVVRLSGPLQTPFTRCSPGYL